jgi:hypothetical protein
MLKFLLEQSSKNMKNYFFIQQLVNAYSEVERGDKKKSEYLAQGQSVSKNSEEGSNRDDAREFDGEPE